MIFKDRTFAGNMLAERLGQIDIENPMIIAIPRGGVLIADPVAKKFNTNIKLITPRKIGAPINREVAIGAVTQDGTVIYDNYLMDILGLSEEDLAEDVENEILEISRRSSIYPNIVTNEDITGRIVILLDDGIATGYTVFAALRSIRNYQPHKLILAIPVAPQEIINRLRAEVDEVVCLESPDDFYAVGQFYEKFEQVKDEEVLEILK